MKRFAKFLSALAVMAFLAFSIGDTAPANAQGCILCLQSQPQPLPGFTMVPSNYAVQDGEFMMCSTAYGTYCQKTGMGPGGFYNLGNMADWGSAKWRVSSITSRLHRASTLYAGVNWTGSSFSWGPQFNPQYGPVAPTVVPNSFAINN